MKRIKSELSSEIRQWVETASPEDIAKCIELGYAANKMLSRNDGSGGSTQKGQMGEKIVFDALQSHFKIRDTSSIAKSGDFHIETMLGNVMVEVKNYSKPVGRAEVEKFHRDLSRNNDVQAGLFVSLYSPIVGVRERVYFETELIHGRKIPVMYIQDSTPEVIRLMVDVLIAHLKADRVKDHEILTSKIEQLSDDIVSLSKARIQLGEVRLTLNKALDDLHLLIASAEINLTRTIDDIRKNIRWKHAIPHEKYSEIWKFVKTTFGMSDDERKAPVRDLKQLLQKMYNTLDLEIWYYTHYGIVVGEWKVFIYNDLKSPEVKFPKSPKTKKMCRLVVNKDNMPIIVEELNQI
jgi:hypothetical protein